MNKSSATRVKLGSALFLLVFFLMSGKVLYDRHFQLQKDYATNNAPLIASQGPIVTSADAESAAVAAGFTKSSELHGIVDTIKWDASSLTASGWVIDTNKKDNRGTYGVPVALAFFQNGILLGSIMPFGNRPDIKEAHHTKALNYFEFSVDKPCQEGEPIIVIAFSPSHKFSVLQQISITCPVK